MTIRVKRLGGSEMSAQQLGIGLGRSDTVHRQFRAAFSRLLRLEGEGRRFKSGYYEQAGEVAVKARALQI